MEKDTDRNDPMTTEHEIVVSAPEDENPTDRDRDGGQILTSGQGDHSQSAGRMPARRGE